MNPVTRRGFLGYLAAAVSGLAVSAIPLPKKPVEVSRAVDRAQLTGVQGQVPQATGIWLEGQPGDVVFVTDSMSRVWEFKMDRQTAFEPLPHMTAPIKVRWAGKKPGYANLQWFSNPWT